ncbi:MAG: hypothetical protein B6U65_01305 [Candidatus Wolframiiraptor sp. EX4484-121]|nr:MAG: hypothetical protein B6U65_01305 [Candidatus Wolframiiraptor sp. EX4484-121]
MRTVNPHFLKKKVKALEEENLRLRRENGLLRDRISSLQAENDSLKQKIAEIESGSLGIRKVSDENGDRIELTPSQEFTARLTSDGVLKPMEPNVLRIGDDEEYLNDVVTANITIPSAAKFKENIRELDPSLLDVELPSPKVYERAEGRGGMEIGFLAEELPEFLRRGRGYDLKALIAILALKVSRLEQELSRA